MILRTNGQPFASEQSAKSARTKMGFGDSHDVVLHEGGFALRERVGGGAPSREQTPCEKLGYKVGDEFEVVGDHFYFSKGEKAVLAEDDGSNNPYFYNRNGNHGIEVTLSLVKPLPITLRPGDYVLTEGMSEGDYHAVAAAFMAAGCGKGEYPDVNYLESYSELGWCCIHDALWHQGGTGHVNNYFEGRQLAIAQVLGAVNANPAEPECEPEQEQKTMQPSLADQLETALATLADAQQTVDRLREEYRAAYPLIHGVVEPKEDMSDPANWRAGDVFKYVGHESTWYTKGKEYAIKKDEQGFYVLDDVGDVMRNALNEGRLKFVRRP